MRLIARSDSDLPVLAALLDSIHASDRYPPHVTGDARDFVASPQELWAQVALDDGGSIRGHASLLTFTAQGVMQLGAAAAGVDVSQLAAVARLFVDPAVRRQSAGRSLLEAAQAEACRRHLVPVLDVWVELAGAIALYESCGWRRVGAVTIGFNSPCTRRCSHEGRSIRSFIYLAPGVAS